MSSENLPLAGRLLRQRPGIEQGPDEGGAPIQTGKRQRPHAVVVGRVYVGPGG